MLPVMNEKSVVCAKFRLLSAGLAVSMLGASCGLGTTADADHAEGDSAVSSEEIEALTEKAEEALEKAEDAERAIEGIEAELLAMVMAEDGEGAEGGHGQSDSGHGESESEPEEEVHAGPIHWSYSGEEGPSSWAELSADFAVCEAGVAQSPIDIVSEESFVVGLDDLGFSWSETDIEVIDNGHTIQANVAAGNTTTFDGQTYDLLQFHFHRPSEHTVENEAFPMELHFVHADANGSLAVVGVLLAAGEENEAFDGIWSAQTATGSDAVLEGFDLSSLLPEDLGRYRYSGSLTTPPCSEGVNWNVLSSPVSLSQDQIDAFLYEGNARPIQNLNGRSVLSDDS